MEQIVHVNIGLPGSGKSRWARNYVKDHPNTVIICRDNLREMVYGEYEYHRDRESDIKDMEVVLICFALHRYRDVILDGCHISRRQRAAVRKAVDITLGDWKDGPDIRIHYEVFPENKRNVDFRMEGDKGVSRERWEGVVDGMLAAYEAPTEDEMNLFNISQMVEHPIPDSVEPRSKGWLSPHWQQGIPPDGVPCILNMIKDRTNPNYIFDMANAGSWTKCYPHDVSGWLPVGELG